MFNINNDLTMIEEYPVLEATEPDGTQYTIQLEDIITEPGKENFISIGRQSDNHIVLSDPPKNISRRHCSLQYRKNRWWIVDENSANGTFLQREIDQPEIDVRSEDAISLRTGDCILILGKLSSSKQPIFWRLEFIDPAETSPVPSPIVNIIEYSLKRKTLVRNICGRRELVSLGAKQLSLIDYMSRKNHENNDQIVICEHEELIHAIWQDNIFGRNSTDVTHLVWQVREKIELDSGEPKFLKTVHGRGYCLDVKIVE